MKLIQAESAAHESDAHKWSPTKDSVKILTQSFGGFLYSSACIEWMAI